MKFVVRGQDSLFSALENLRVAIEGIPSIDVITTDTSLYMDTDTYFRSYGEAQFLRVRRTEGQRETLVTVKTKDKGNNIDRLEHEFITDVEYPKGFFRSVLGDPLGEISKTYMLYKLNYEGFKLECAFYKVEGDSDRRLFLEVEGQDDGAVASFVSLLRSRLDIASEVRSIFELFIAPPEFDRAA
jgi:adenylate cyclase class IV